MSPAWRPVDVPPLRDRLWAGLARDEESGCLIWQGPINNRGCGYTSDGSRRKAMVHRLLYELERGPIPAGLTIDHLCFTPACANVDHLEAVTQAVNNKRARQRYRATHCKRGHAFPDSDGWRRCQVCIDAYEKARSARRSAERAAAKQREVAA